MTEDDVRAIVREAIRQARAAAPGPPAWPAAPSGSGEPMIAVRRHPSHALFVVPAGADAEGPCVIEPAVACNHCGYCRSYGH